jgi:hypothetical protein
MTSRTQRVAIRATAIGAQWLALTIALGALVMRSDESFSEVISPNFGAMPVIFGAMLAAFLLGLTIESPRYLAPLVILMALVSSTFIGVISYAPIVEGLLVRTTSLDDFVAQRVIIMTLIMMLAMVPATVAGNLLGGRLNVRQEIAPHPEDLSEGQEVPWWERRSGSSGTTANEAEHHIV